MGALTDARAEKACQEYVLNGGDQSKAYRAAYQGSRKRKDKSVHESASRLFAQVKVKSRVEELKAEAVVIAQEKFGVDAEWLLRRFVDEADADIADLYDHITGALKPVHQWPMVWRRGLVAGIDVQRIGSDENSIGEVVKVKLADRTRIKELIGKHVSVGAFDETVNHKHTGEVVTRIELVPASRDDN